MTDSFNKQFDDSRWKEREDQLKEKFDYKCQDCQISQELRTHICYWQKDLPIWEYPDEALRCLCLSCDKQRTNLEKEIRKTLALFVTDELESLQNALELMKRIEAGRGPAMERLYIFAKKECKERGYYFEQDQAADPVSLEFSKGHHRPRQRPLPAEG